MAFDTSGCGPTGCSAPGMAELADGRVVLAFGTNGDVHDVQVFVLPTDPMDPVVNRAIGTGDAPFVVPRADGTVWIGYATATGVVLHPVNPNSAVTDAGPTTIVSTPGVDYSRTMFARHGNALAITYVQPSAPFGVYLSVVCDGD